MIEAKEELKFELLADPREKVNRDQEVFGIGMFALHKDGNDRFPIEIELLEDDGELFDECLKRARSKSKTKRLGKGSVVRVKGSVKHSSWRTKDGWGGKYSFRPTEVSYG
jgi:hypothetical protein